MSIDLLANDLVLSGVALLGWSLIKVCDLIKRLPDSPLRQRWYVLAGLIVLFVAGYLAYVVVLSRGHSEPIDLIVPAVFFFGACFVLPTAILSLNTAVSILRISVLEQETFTDPLRGLFNRRFLESKPPTGICIVRKTTGVTG